MSSSKAVAGLTQINNVVEDKKMTFSIPNYSPESKNTRSNYIKEENAGQRYGSNINDAVFRRVGTTVQNLNA